MERASISLTAVHGDRRLAIVMSRRTRRHPEFMRFALELAQEAADVGEIPVGAIVVSEGAIVGRGRNERQLSHDPSDHAEIVALRRAAKAVGGWRIPKSTLYVTLEPCLMCAGAILHSHIDRVVFGCRDPKSGAVRSLYAVLEDPRATHRIQVVERVLEQECREILQTFFEALRSKVDKDGTDADPWTPWRGGRVVEGA